LSAKGNGPKRKPAKRQTAAEKAAKEAEDRAEMKELSRIQNQRDDDMYAHMLEPGYGSNYGKLPKGWRESDVASGKNGPPTGKGYSHPRPAFKSTAFRVSRGRVFIKTKVQKLRKRVKGEKKYHTVTFST
jgi:hypothetical protein